MINPFKDSVKLTEVARTYWHTPYGLLLAEILFLSLVVAILSAFKPSLIYTLITSLLGCTITFIIWWYTNRLPKTKKNKIGFVLSISTGDEIERKKIIEDFVLTLHELLKGGASGNSFQIINLPEYVAGEIIDHEHAQEIRKRCRAHFLIFGRVRLRDICGKQEHVLHLEGQVAHRPLPSNFGAEFAKEFTELFPRRLRIATENDIFSFAFTSDWINCVSRYIIGIAAVCSGDLDYAEKLQKDVESLLANKDPSFPIFAILKKRVPIRLGEIYQAQANISYERWVKNHDPAEIAEMGNYLDKIPPSYANEYPVVLLKSVFLFLQYRDVRGALQVVKNCRTIHEGTWLYNMGFLHAYMGNLKKAIQCYNKALGLPIEPIVIAKIEEFIVWVIEQEPSNYQLYYCLGYLNYKVKGDDVQAKRDFETFLAMGEETQFVKERELAQRWILEMQGP